MTSGESFKSDNRRDKRWKQRETKRRAGKKYSSIQREIGEIGYVPATFVNYGVTKLALGKSVVGWMPKEIKPPRWKRERTERRRSWFRADSSCRNVIYILATKIFYRFNNRNLWRRWCIKNNMNSFKKNTKSIYYIIIIYILFKIKRKVKAYLSICKQLKFSRENERKNFQLICSVHLIYVINKP